MQVREIMSQAVDFINPNTKIGEAAKRMRDEDIGALPVGENDRLVGMITDRDIAVRAVADGKSTESTTVGEIASRELVTIDPQQDLDEALRLMAKHQVRRLPVVEEDGRLVGIVAQADIAEHAEAARVGETVEQISE